LCSFYVSLSENPGKPGKSIESLKIKFVVKTYPKECKTVSN